MHHNVLRSVGLAALGFAAACGGNGSGGYTPPSSSSGALTGRLLDVSGGVVAGAEVSLAVGSLEITDRVRTDAQGAYALSFGTDAVKAAMAAGQEVTLLFHSPTTDRAPLGTAEGDFVHLLPVTLRQFADLSNLESTIAVRDAHVPFQGRGYAITDALIREGGVLTWSPEGTQYGEGFEVSLIIEPGSIHKGDDAQEEITLTLLEQAMAPMAIPEDGFGPLWTVQPRDVTFNPPARIRIEGKRLPVLGTGDLQVGQATELYGASLETGWKLFGDITLKEMNGDFVTLETEEGIIQHGAWGHVFNNMPGQADYGLLVQCFEVGTANPIPCAVLDDNGIFAGGVDTCADADGSANHTGVLKCEQVDYNGRHHPIYSAVTEPRCRGCGSNPTSQLAMGVEDLSMFGQGTVSTTVYAVSLCPSEQQMTDMNQLYGAITDRYERIVASLPPGADTFTFDTWDGHSWAVADLAWRNFNRTMRIYIKGPEGCN